VRAVIGVVPWLAVGVGVALGVAGAAIVLGRPVHIGLPAAVRLRSLPSAGYARVAGFGVSYAIASLSCTFAVVLAVAGQATATADPWEFALVFAAFAAGATSVLLALALSVALATTLVARAMRALGPLVERVAGAMLAASGIYLVAYWAPVLFGSNAQPGGPITRTLERASATASNFLSTHTGAFAIALAIAGVAAAVLFATRRPTG
jgi:cytochrome c-type biogenesis protein